MSFGNDMKKAFLCGVFLWFSICALPLHAGQLVAPHDIEYGGKKYETPSRSRIGERYFYKYTLSGEGQSAWTSMVVLQFAPDFNLEGYAWAKDVRDYLENVRPKPYYDISSIGGKPIVRFFAPINDDNVFESNVMRFFPGACGGQVVFQYVEKNDIPGGNVSAALAKNKTLVKELLENLNWQPACTP